MPTQPLAPPLTAAIKKHGIAATARDSGVSVATLHRALRRGAASGATVQALERIKDKLRVAEEFKGAGSVGIRAPRKQTGIHSWDLERIREARDAQMLGSFAMPVAMATAMKTDDAIFTAYHNRIAPCMAVPVTLESAGGARGDAVAKRAALGVTCSRNVLQSIIGTLADHAIAIGYVEQEPSADGTRVDFKLTQWPLEHVKWNQSREVLETTVRNGMQSQPIVHGDGRWVRFQRFADEPWARDRACILPGALLWPAHAEAIRDWSAASFAHGQAKVVGKLPDAGFTLRGPDGELTPEAREFVRLLQDLISGDAGAGIAPFGSEVEMLFNGSTAWQGFERLAMNREKVAARIYQGTDATLGSVGGAPGVDIEALFGVATTIIQGDFQCVEDALFTGLYQPWCAVNTGDSRYAPRFRYMIPDPDLSKRVESYDKRLQGFFAALEKFKANGMVLGQDEIAALAKQYGVDAPVLAPTTARAVPLTLAPTDMAKVVRVREARSSQGLQPFGDERDDMTITQLDALAAAGPAAAPAAPAPPAPAALSTLAGFDEQKHPRADDGKFGHGSGGSGGGSNGGSEGENPKAPSSENRDAVRKRAQEHYDATATKARDVARAGGHNEAVNNFLNVERAAVSRAERTGQPNATSDATTRFLHEARAAGADYRAPVYRGTNPAELDAILKGGTNPGTWSVSKDAEHSAPFAKKGGVLLVIKGRHGAIPTDGLDGSNTFSEALIPKGTKWRKASERNANGVRVVTLEPIDGDGDGIVNEDEKK